MSCACEAYLGLLRICYEWNDLEAAQQYGQQSAQLARQLIDNDKFIVREPFHTRLKVAQRDEIGAATMLAETKQFLRQHNFLPWMPEATAVQVLTLVHQGDLASATDLVEKYELHPSQARVHLTQGDASSALALLKPFHQHAAVKGWVDERLKVTVLQAVAFYVHGEKKVAVQPLGDALALVAELLTRFNSLHQLTWTGKPQLMWVHGIGQSQLSFPGWWGQGALARPGADSTGGDEAARQGAERPGGYYLC